MVWGLTWLPAFSLSSGSRSWEQVSFLSQMAPDQGAPKSGRAFLPKAECRPRMKSKGVGEIQGCNPHLDPPVLVLVGDNWVRSHCSA